MRVMLTARAFFFLAAAISLLGPGVVRADTASPTPPSADESAKQGTAPADSAGKKPEDSPASDTPAVVVDDNKVESLLGKDVTSAKGEKLGQITDILVSHAGEIRAAVIDFGGFLGVGSRKIAVAWPTLHFSPKAITLGMTRDELRVTPEYRPGEPIVIVGAVAKAANPQAASPAPAAQPSGSPPPALTPSPAPDK